MSRRVPTCTEQTSLPELQRLLQTSREGRLAVIADGRVVGVVTRSDVLRGLGGPAGREAEPFASLADELRSLPALAAAYDPIAAIAEHHEGVYLVGGTVRDILLGETGFDVDIAVEGDGIAFASELARTLGGRFTPHERFGSAVVLYGVGERIDVVTTRTEFYDAPGALPAVERASIHHDLFRRDFTVNAMAVSLRGDDFGRLVDPFGGRRDLEAGVLRVLHNLSFIDDPTRIFRAIRYESRYGFRMDDHTAELARQCIELGLVGDVSTARLRDELIALLEEGPARYSLLRLAEIGADQAIHPRLAADEEAAGLLERLRELKRRYDVAVPDWRLGLIVLARRLASHELYDWLERLKVRRRHAEQIAWAVAAAPLLAERLRNEELDAAGIVAAVERHDPDVPLFTLALDPDLRALHEYFTRLRDVRLEVTGEDLAALGIAESPRVGEILAELRRRKLNAELDGRDAELAAARELATAGA